MGYAYVHILKYTVYTLWIYYYRLFLSICAFSLCYFTIVIFPFSIIYWELKKNLKYCVWLCREREWHSVTDITNMSFLIRRPLFRQGRPIGVKITGSAPSAPGRGLIRPPICPTEGYFYPLLVSDESNYGP